MTSLVIKGGIVVSAHSRDRADLAIEDGIARQGRDKGIVLFDAGADGCLEPVPV